MTSYLKPKILHTDNGGEFRDLVVTIYLKENNINHITRCLYNTQHQGVVEVFNKTIQDFFDISSGSSRDNFVELILLMISVYITTTEGIVLPKSDQLN